MLVKLFFKYVCENYERTPPKDPDFLKNSNFLENVKISRLFDTFIVPSHSQKKKEFVIISQRTHEVNDMPRYCL